MQYDALFTAMHYLLPNVLFCFVRLCERSISRAGNVVFSAEVLHESLGSFKTCCRCCRAKYPAHVQLTLHRCLAIVSSWHY